jgi:arylsulfatase
MKKNSSVVWLKCMQLTPNIQTVEIGRVIDYLEESGQLENTLILYCADNGAFGEGTPNGSINENRFYNGFPDDIKQNMEMIDKLGSPDTYNHYPTGWATAFSTPYRMFKRYASYAGGTCRSTNYLLAKGNKSKRRIASSISSLHRYCTNDP